MSEYKGSSADGQRQSYLEKQRSLMLAEFKKQKSQIEKDNRVVISNDKFVAEIESSGLDLLKGKGLISLDELQRMKESLGKDKVDKEPVKSKKKKKVMPTLSFSMEDEEETYTPTIVHKKVKLGKDPTIDTSFLPDKDREEEELALKTKFRMEWESEQDKLKNESIKVVYSYWDGVGHRYEVECKKGDTISKFLERCRQQVHELRGVNVDNLIYVKEDLIIPQHYTFYDFIVNKARGKTGPLFNFDVQDDVRLELNASIETEESHAGKVLERSWYEKHKHIFPASRWELFDPTKNYGKYSLKDKKPKLNQ